MFRNIKQNLTVQSETTSNIDQQLQKFNGVLQDEVDDIKANLPDNKVIKNLEEVTEHQWNKIDQLDILFRQYQEQLKKQMEATLSIDQQLKDLDGSFQDKVDNINSTKPDNENFLKQETFNLYQQSAIYKLDSQMFQLQ